MQLGGTQVAIGDEKPATRSNQQPYAVAIGLYAGNVSQGAYTVSLGHAAGAANQSAYQVNIGRAVNELPNESDYSVTVGDAANRGSAVRPRNVVFGAKSAGLTGAAAAGVICFAGENGVAMGSNASRGNGSNRSVALGLLARRNGANLDDGIAVGLNAGYNNQATGAIAVGVNAGYNNQGQHSVALGANAAYNFLGDYSIAVGVPSSNVAQGDNSIVLQADGGGGLATLNNSFRVADLRQVDSGTGKVSAIPGWYPVVRLGDELVYSTD